MRILVAEDDVPLAELLHQRLVQEQFSVQVVSNGPEAQRLASDQSYDLVLLDLNLPGGEGLDVLCGIRSKRPDLPVVIVTNASTVEERVCGLDAGADDYVAKPFEFCRACRAHSGCLAQGNPARAHRAPNWKPRSRPCQSHRAPRKSQHRSERQGICFAVIPDAP